MYQSNYSNRNYNSHYNLGYKGIKSYNIEPATLAIGTLSFVLGAKIYSEFGSKKGGGHGGH